jgi:hypothetical protein
MHAQSREKRLKSLPVLFNIQFRNTESYRNLSAFALNLAGPLVEEKLTKDIIKLEDKETGHT